MAAQGAGCENTEQARTDLEAAEPRACTPEKGVKAELPLKHSFKEMQMRGGSMYKTKVWRVVTPDKNKDSAQR